MRMPRTPPPYDELIGTLTTETILTLMKLAVEDTSPGGKYLHWDEMRVRQPPEGYTTEEWWLATKLRRSQVRQYVPFADKAGHSFSYSDSGDLYRRLREIDSDASGQIAFGTADGVHEPSGERYLMSSLIDEAITSSQLEGAATTRVVAKEMLRTGRSPRDNSERMIVNNYHAMEFLRGNHGEKLTRGMLLELQTILTQGTMSDDSVGRFRRPTDNVDVAQWDGTVVHVPPKAVEIDARIDRLLAFANEEDDGRTIHPFVRAVILHFMIGYDHPFVDGNGRTARGLFYWSMAKSGYWLTEYLSISTVIRESPARYVQAYVYSETDDGDLTYFIEYNLGIMLKAIRALHEYLDKKAKEMEGLSRVIRGSELAMVFNYRQLALLSHLVKHPNAVYTIAGHRRSHNVTYQTARSDLLTLAEFGFLEVAKVGRKLQYRRSEELEDDLRDLAGFIKAET